MNKVYVVNYFSGETVKFSFKKRIKKGGTVVNCEQMQISFDFQLQTIFFG